MVDAQIRIPEGRDDRSRLRTRPVAMNIAEQQHDRSPEILNAAKDGLIDAVDPRDGDVVVGVGLLQAVETDRFTCLSQRDAHAG